MQGLSHVFLQNHPFHEPIGPDQRNHTGRGHRNTRPIPWFTPKPKPHSGKGYGNHRQLADFDTDVKPDQGRNKLTLRQTKFAQYGCKPQSMQQATQAQNGAQIAEISQAIHACQQAIDHLFEKLDDVTRELGTRGAEFESRLQQLDIENP